MAKPFNGKAKRKKLTIVGPHIGGRGKRTKKGVHKHGMADMKSGIRRKNG